MHNMYEDVPASLFDTQYELQWRVHYYNVYEIQTVRMVCFIYSTRNIVYIVTECFYCTLFWSTFIGINIPTNNNGIIIEYRYSNGYNHYCNI